MDAASPIISPEFPRKGKFNSKVLAGVFIFVAVIIGTFAYQSRTKSNNEPGNVVIEEKPDKATKILPIDDDIWETQYIMPAQEKNRMDILILGVRGKDDIDGGLLTDAIIVLSYDEITKKSSLVSIPRDLYVRLNDNTEDKINTAYEYLGLQGAKRLYSRITGVYIDQVVVLDFSSFKEIVDDLGGIDITLVEPFTEPEQWGYEFTLPAGTNHLDGQAALYYTRSRYSTDDFDRARRQQEIIFAIKKRIFEINFLSEPTKALALLTNLKKNIHTDINILDVTAMINLAQELNATSPKQSVISNADLLYDARVNNIYILLPKGDNLSAIKQHFKTILASAPAGGGATPTPK